MRNHDLYVVERFRPAQATDTEANDLAARRHGAQTRPHSKEHNMFRAGRTERPVKIHKFVDLKETLKPFRYAIDRIVCRGRIYTLTSPTGGGKTTWCTMAALAVATGRSDILNMEVGRGRVAYLAIENPDDTISRFAVAQRHFEIPDSKLRERLFIIKVKATPESVFDALARLSESGAFALVIVDTLAAYFDGADLNDNVAVGNFMRRLRRLTRVLGNPAVVVPAHPIKGASQGSLVPYGGGAIVNEVDGNLTLWRARRAVKLHWQTKIRGPNFQPVLFHFRDCRCDEVRDAKGRRIIMPLLVPGGEEREPSARPATNQRPLRSNTEQRNEEDRAPPRLPGQSRGARQQACSEVSGDVRLLRAMIAYPDGTQAEWAGATGVATSNVNRRLKRLEEGGLVRGAHGRWTVRSAGKTAVQPEAER